MRNEEVKIIPGPAPLAAAIKLPFVEDLLPSPGSCCVTHSECNSPLTGRKGEFASFDPQVALSLVQYCIHKLKIPLLLRFVLATFGVG